MRVGVCLLPELPWAQDRHRWQEAERAGFGTAWTYDHLSWTTLRDGPWYGAVPLLAAAATSTSTIRLGTLVTSPNFRHPVPLAKEVMTLDDLSGGRLTLGIGAGADSEDARVLGKPPWGQGERTSRFEEFCELLDRLLTQPATTSSGRWYSANDARQIPGCVQSPRVPFAIAAAGPRAMAIAARLGGGWVTYGRYGNARDLAPNDWFATVSDQVGQLGEALAAAGRRPEELSRTMLVPLDLPWAQASPDAWDDFVGHLEGVGMTDVVVHWPRPSDPVKSGPNLRTFEHITNSLK
ncbi:MAG: hypothetical protein JWM85_2969 [Acidimicrobiaceae bacterium]|nr:hypothetical protein [Acidimicrobiaceae bacterium]